MCDVITNKKGLCPYCATSQKTNGWRNTKDELPKENKWYLTFNQAQNFSIRYYDGKQFDFDLKSNKITHWMPLPNKPERKSKYEKRNNIRRVYNKS